MSDQGFVIWFTGLSGSGKSTLAEALAPTLRERGRNVEILDGDIVRTNLSKGLGFSKEDRDTNIRRIGFVASLLARNGVGVITAAISPYQEIRDENRAMTEGDGAVFVEVHAAATVEQCEARDVKGLYAKARAGEIKGFTGIDDPYEDPPTPEVRCETGVDAPDTNLQQIIDYLEARGLIGGGPLMSALGEPYGGDLVDLLVSGEEREELGREVASLPTIEFDSRTTSDFELLANGGFSPLTGFMGEAEYHSVVEDMKLANGLPWSIPVTLSVPESRAADLTPGVRADLRDAEGFPLGVIDIEDVYRRDKTREAEQVFRTTDEAHPGVAALYASGDLVIGGTVKALRLPDHENFPDHRLTPAQTRAAFAERGWRTIVGFQTRNPIHRAHEYLIKVALEGVDGALIHPLVGDTKDDDIPADVRMRCYEVLLERYFPADRAHLSVLPAAMRYAGPREAIFHAIMRKNYGCTHFIVGRDHAGVGNYYGTYDAQRIFDDIDLDALGIQPLFFEHAFWCLRSGAMATTKTSAATPEERLFLSGTRVREMLANGEDLPVEFTRPEVAAVLMESARSG